MIEKLPQSNPEQSNPKRFLIPMPGNTCVFGVVNEARQAISISRQKNAPDMIITMVEVAYEVVGQDGEPAIETKMVSDHIFNDEVQADLMQKYLNSVNADTIEPGA